MQQPRSNCASIPPNFLFVGVTSKTTCILQNSITYKYYNGKIPMSGAGNTTKEVISQVVNGGHFQHPIKLNKILIL